MGFNPLEDLVPSDKTNDQPQERREGNVAANIFEDMKSAFTQGAGDRGGSQATEMPDLNTDGMWEAYDDLLPTENIDHAGLQWMGPVVTGDNMTNPGRICDDADADDTGVGKAHAQNPLDKLVDSLPQPSDLAKTPMHFGEAPLPYPNVDGAAAVVEDANDTGRKAMLDIQNKMQHYSNGTETMQELGDQQGAISGPIELNWDVEQAPDISELAVTPNPTGEMPLPYPNVDNALAAAQGANDEAVRFMKDVYDKNDNVRRKITEGV